MEDHRPAEDAVAEAFAAPLSRVRTWGAAVMLATGWWWLARAHQFDHDSVLALLPVVAFPGLVLALLLGKPWARVLLLGWSVSIALFWLTMWLYTHSSLHPGASARWHRVSEGAAAAHGFAAIVLAPWRRRELSRHGWALVALALAGQHAWLHSLGTERVGDLALAALLLAAVGGVSLARWTSALAVVAGCASLLAALHLWSFMDGVLLGHDRYDKEPCLAPAGCKALSISLAVQLFGGTVTCLVAAILARRRYPPVTREQRDAAEPALPDTRRRWAVLFGSAMTCLVAMSWDHGGFDELSRGGMPVVGVSLCAAIGVWCAMTNMQRRWPAVVAVAVAFMVALDLVDRLPYLAEWLDRAGAAGLLLMAGKAAMIGSALFVAIRKLPAPPPIPLAHQR